MTSTKGRGARFAAALLALGVACSPARSHIFIADFYEAAIDCLDVGVGVDVADGPPSDQACDAACVVQPEGGVYVTSQCRPYPLGWDTSGTDPSCSAALAARARGDFCVDGGNPEDGSADGPSDAAGE
jgi:hypothetical protein